MAKPFRGQCNVSTVEFGGDDCFVIIIFVNFLYWRHTADSRMSVYVDFGGEWRINHASGYVQQKELALKTTTP